MLQQSEADAAYNKLRKLIEARQVFRYDDPRLSEADVRAKLIDPIFRDVLCWSESDIRREKPSSSGFADYLLGSDAAYLLIEAKRTNPRFRLEAPSNPRKLNLEGPHLLGQKKMREPLEQAQRYASELGAQFAVLTNGSQFILFRPYLPGRAWTFGIAIVFHGHDDIVQNFAYFFRLLARDHVVSGALLDAFEEAEGITETLYAPTQFLDDADEELIRNPFWTNLSRVMIPLLTDEPENPAAHAEIIQNCYVTTRLSDQADKGLNQLLQDIPGELLKQANVEDTGVTKRDLFAYRFERDIEKYHPGTYILTGGVGSGKTTFLHRFALVVEAAFLKQYCIWLQIDFRPIGNVDINTQDERIVSYVYQQMRTKLETDYPDKMPQTGEAIRELFADHIDRVKKTRLYGVPEGSAEWLQQIGQVVDGLYNSDREFATAVLRSLVRRGLRLVIALDNTDQLGEQFQERVFLFAQRLSQEHRALCIVTLREERFFAAFRRGIFDAFGDRRFHIGSPQLSHVLRARLEYGSAKFRDLASTGKLDLSKEELEQIEILLGILIQSTTQKNANIVRMLACVSNGDMRHALGMFREFISSGNTDVGKILDIFQRYGSYTVPFHEFAKSSILGSKKYFRGTGSHIVNVFKQSAARRASHITGLRVLARLNHAGDASSQHGEGFVRTATLLKEYRASFGYAEDFEEVVGEFIRRGLIESEPPRTSDTSQSIALRISASGSYYWRYLVRAFAYIDLVYVDTAISDRAVAKRLGDLATVTDMAIRFERVRLFLKCLANKEQEELEEVAKRSGPYRQGLIPEVKEQIEREIMRITGKL